MEEVAVVSKKFLIESRLEEVIAKYPFAEDFLKDNHIDLEFEKL